MSASRYFRDPVLRAFMGAPEDDEPLTPEDIAAIEEGKAEIARGDLIPWEEVKTVPTKEQMLKLIQELPADATVEDAMERLYLLQKIERGIAQAEAGHTVSQEEARQRMARWLA